MKDFKKLGELSLLDILESSVGREEAERLLGTIQEAITKGMSGDDLKKFIYQELCRSSVTDIEVYMLFSLPVIIHR